MADTTGINLRDRHGRSALHIAASNGYSGIVGALLGARISINALDNSNNTALHYTLQYNHVEVAEVLLTRLETDPNLCDASGTPPLQFAIARGHNQIASALLSHPYTILDNFFDDVVANGDLELVTEFISNPKFNCNFPNEAGLLPLHSAIRNGDVQIVKKLLAREDVCVSSVDKTKKTPLQLAASLGHHRIVKMLYSRKGLDINAVSVDGKSALDLAKEGNHAEVVRVLRTHPRIEN